VNKFMTLYLFSTRVSFGQRGIERIGSINLKPAPRALAVLCLCRRIHEEAKSFWLSRILFDFEDVKSLLDKLSALPSIHSPKSAMFALVDIFSSSPGLAMVAPSTTDLWKH
jgi:hypothetical protein